MFRSIQPHSNPPRFTQSCSRFSLIPTDSFRFAQIHSDLLRLAQTSSNWQILKGKGKCSHSRVQREKGRGPTSHFIPDSTWITLRARTHGRDETTSRLGCSVLADSLPPNLRQIPESPTIKRHDVLIQVSWTTCQLWWYFKAFDPYWIAFNLEDLIQHPQIDWHTDSSFRNLGLS